MSSKNSSYQISPIKWPVRRLEDAKSIHKAFKNCDRTTRVLSIADNSVLLQKIRKLFQRIKYCGHLKVQKAPLQTPNQIKRFLLEAKRLKTLRGLKLHCSNSNADTRITQYKTLKPLIHFNHLDTITFHVFLVKNLSLFEKFGSLVQSFRAKNINIKEPLAFMPERYVRRFYSKVKDSGKRLTSLKLSNHAPFTGPFENFTLYKFIETATDLKELHLSFVGISARDHFLTNLINLLTRAKNLSVVSLDLSFNYISDLERLEPLQSLPLEKVELNFSHCPLNQTSFINLANFLYSLPDLKDLKLNLSSLEIDQRSLTLVINAIKSLKMLTSLSLSLNENRCIETSVLHNFFSHLLNNPKLIRINLGLSRALIGGFRSDLPSLSSARKPALKYLALDLSNNKLRDSEMTLITQFCQGYTDLEELKLSLENCRFGENSSETVWGWIASLKRLRSLDISLLFSELSDASLFCLLRALLQMRIENLVLDLTDVVNSKNSAEVLLLALLAMKSLKSFKIHSNQLKQALPRDFLNITQKQLPNCSRFEICA